MNKESDGMGWDAIGMGQVSWWGEKSLLFSRDCVVFLFPDTFRIKWILSFLLFLDTVFWERLED